MKKAIVFIACVASALVILSAFTYRNESPREGYLAPRFEISNGSSSFSPGRSDNYRLLTFWSTSDAPSRMACNQYATAANDLGIDFVGINMDGNIHLFQEIASRDGLDLRTQYHISGNALEKISKSYRLEKGLNSFLIDKSGRIKAVNPDVAHLANLLH